MSSIRFLSVASRTGGLNQREREREREKERERERKREREREREMMGERNIP